MKITIIGIAGASGSGKTTIANALREHYGAQQCTIISSDNYYKGMANIPQEKKHEVNFDHPDSIEFELLVDHLRQLKLEQPVEIPTYDFSVSSRKKETLHIVPTPIIIVEGILILHPDDLAALFDIKIFVKTQLDLCLIRRLERDISERGRTIEEVIAQYKKDVKPMYERFVKPCKSQADLVIENSDEVIAREGLQFDMRPIVDSLDRAKLEKPSIQFRFKLFSRSTDMRSFPPSPAPALSLPSS